ncbi:hypothetical protein FLA_0362 [Filimonas lacunae]|nr:hypothetical protein FLA_0362 [Filimonas lacunae]
MPVFKVVYFQAQNPAGYVLHEATDNLWHQLFISTGPFLFNTLVAALIALPAALPVFEYGNANLFHYLLMYLSVAIGMHAFPSTGDANALWSSIRRETTPFWLKVLVTPVVGIMYLGALSSFFWLDMIYGLAIAIGFPKLLIALLA